MLQTRFPRFLGDIGNPATFGSVGVVSVDASALSAAVLEAAGALPSTPLEGLAPSCAFQRALLDDEASFDSDAARAATVEAALRLVRRRPDVAVLVLECTNMPPYADAVRKATGRPVHDIVSGLVSRLLPAPLPQLPTT